MKYLFLSFLLIFVQRLKREILYTHHRDSLPENRQMFRSSSLIFVATRDAALDQLRKSSSFAAGRRSIHHQYARKKAILSKIGSAAAAAVSDGGGAGQGKQQQKQQSEQVAPTLREQMMLKQRESKIGSFRNMPPKIRERRQKLRVFNKDFEMFFFFREEDVEEQSILGRGPGGQATNRRRQTCQLRHKPSGLMVRLSKYRSLYMNRKVGRMMLSWQLEKALFGKFSRLGADEARKRTREKRRRKIRTKLLHMAERCSNEIIHQKIDTNNDTANSNNRRFPVSVSYARVLGCEDKSGEKISPRDLNHLCWSEMGFVTAPLLNSCSSVNRFAEDDTEEEERPSLQTVADLLEPPFADRWWATLQRSWSRTAVAAAGSRGAVIAPPPWFCLLFPTFPSSPVLRPAVPGCCCCKRNPKSALPLGRTFCGPRDAWEGHERSYIKTALRERSELQKLMRRPYVNFCEMFGMRFLEMQKGVSGKVVQISRDDGLNWFEGRQRLCEHPELTTLLWTHVLQSAVEFCFDDIALGVVRFFREGAQSETHPDTRRLFESTFVNFGE